MTKAPDRYCWSGAFNPRGGCGIWPHGDSRQDGFQNPQVSFGYNRRQGPRLLKGRTPAHT